VRSIAVSSVAGQGCAVVVVDACHVVTIQTVVDSPRGRAIWERHELARVCRRVADGREALCAPGAITVGRAVAHTGVTRPALAFQPIGNRRVDALVRSVAARSVAGPGCAVVVKDAFHVVAVQAVIDSPRGRAIGKRYERAHGRRVAAGRQALRAPGAVGTGGAVEDTRTRVTGPPITSRPIGERRVDAFVRGITVDGDAGQCCAIVIADACHVVTI